MQKIIEIVNLMDVRLQYPIELIKQKLQLDMYFIPAKINASPTAYLAILSFFATMVLYFTDTICYTSMAILYPVFYNMNLYKNPDTHMEKILRLNKYWLLLSLMTLIKNIFYPILFLVPMFNYLELVVIYTLLRSDFELCESLFAVFKFYYEGFDVAKKINDMTDKISAKIVNITLNKIETNNNKKDN